MKEKLNIDRIFAHIGELGSQQKRYMFLLCLMNFYAPQFMIQYTFVGHSLDFTCITKNGTLFENSCLNQQSSQCETITFDTSTSDSIVSPNLGWHNIVRHCTIHSIPIADIRMELGL